MSSVSFSKFRVPAILAFAVLLGGPVSAWATESTAEAPRITSQAFGNWTYRCQQPMTGGKPGPAVCELVQNVVVNQEGKTQTVMSVAFQRPPKSKSYVLSFQLPLAVRLRQSVGVSVDDATPQPFSYDFCGPGGCWADGQVGDTLLRGLKRGKTGRAKVVLFNGRPVVIEFPLLGLSDGLAALDSNTKGTP